MKRKSLSSIFSTKTLGIILFIILGVFSFGAKNSEASILVDIKIDNKTGTVLMTPTTIKEAVHIKTIPQFKPIVDLTSWALGRETVTLRKDVLLNLADEKYILVDLDEVDADFNRLNNAVLDKIDSDKNKNTQKYESKLSSYKKTLDSADTANTYPEAKKYLSDVLEEAKFINDRYYLPVYNQLKADPDKKNVFADSQIPYIIDRMVRLYLYRATTDFLLEGKTDLDFEKIPQDLKDAATKIKNDVSNKNFFQEFLSGATDLSDPEKTTGTFTIGGMQFAAPLRLLRDDRRVIVDNPEENIDSLASTVCTDNSIGKILTSSNPKCSLVAFLINSILDGILFLIGGLVKLVGQLFDWVVSFSIYNFNDWVTNSNAYHVWRNVILSLVTSLLLPLVFYMIIRMLIDNDTSRIKKILPRLLITALFVYFSFAIVGWIIDQTNVLSIYLYRSMHDPGQTLGDSLKRILAIDAAAVGISKADWTTTLFQLIKVVINFVSLLVLIQGLVLIFMRAIILVLCLIFSPLMLLPAGINEYIDKYRDMVIKSFTNSAISAPIFMFIVLIALQIGEGIRNSLESNAQLNQIGQGLSGANVTMGATISSIIIIVVLQLAITVSKRMSSDIGGQISGKIGGFVGNLAFGGAAAVARGGVRAVSNNEKFQGWMKKNEGTSRGKLAASMMNTAKSSTFDMRNTAGFQKVSQVTTGDKGSFGKGSTRTIKNSQEAAYVKERAYHNSLTTEQGKKTNLERLRKESSGGVYGKEIADRLEGRESGLSLNERISHEKGYETKFDKANEIKDENKRKDKLIGSIDEHYKDNKKGEKYFTEALEKPENIKLKKDFEEANKKEGAAERKSAIMKTVEDFEKEEKTRAKKEKKEKKKKEEEQKDEKGEGDNLREKIKSGGTKEGLKEKTFTSAPSSTSDKEVLKKMDNISRNTEETKHQLINMNKSVTSLIDSMRNKNTKTSADIPEEYVGTSPSLRNRQMYKRNEKGEFMNLNEEQKAQSKRQRETLNKDTKTTTPEPKNTFDNAA